MASAQVQKDIQYLAGQLTHRGANTENERLAAEYLRTRLSEHFVNAELDDFYSPDNPWYLFASYFGEYVVVGLLAIWWPLAAAVYGSAVFLAYFAEYMGYQVMARFLPHFETQNVLARILDTAADRNVVFVAHYDSKKAGPFSRQRRLIHALQTTASALMLLVVATCAVEALANAPETPPELLTLRWIAVAALLATAVFFAYNELESTATSGANDNASGAAALLQLAERIHETPLKNASVYFTLTGSNQNWMSGARHFIRYHRLDRDNTYIINLDSLARGHLRYTTLLGMLQVHRCAPELIQAAQAAAGSFDAKPLVKRVSDSDALPLLARGYKVIEITSDGSEDNIEEDSLIGIDYNLAANAAHFAEAIARRICG